MAEKKRKLAGAPGKTTETQRSAFLAEADDVFRRVGHLIQQADAIGIARHGFEASGPHETDRSRDVSAGLFVAWRALQASIAFVRDGGDKWPEFRAQVRGARHVFRGGRRDGSPSADRSIAVAMARQAILYSFGIGFPGRTEDDGVSHIRRTYAELFGDVFERTPVDAIIRAHLNATSRTGQALAKWRRGETQREAFDSELELAALALTAEVLWAGREAARQLPQADSTFRFPMDPTDTSRSKLLTRLLAGQRDQRRKARAMQST